MSSSFAHNGLCQPNTPTSLVSGQDPELLDGRPLLVVAGTPCTSWSRMGNRKAWTAPATIGVLFWCFETLVLQPDIILHECTTDFQVGTLEKIFQDKYSLQTLVVSPHYCGWPCTRARRFTLLVNTEKRRSLLSFTEHRFGSVFYRQLKCTGDVFFCADDTELHNFAEELSSKKQLPVPDLKRADPEVQREVGSRCLQPKALVGLFSVSHLQQNQARLPRKKTRGICSVFLGLFCVYCHSPSLKVWKRLLPESTFQRLLQYERECEINDKDKVYIVNLCQNVTFMNQLSLTIPCLLTKTTFLWSMRRARPMLPIEGLEVMGIPVFSPSRCAESRSAVECLWHAKELSHADVAFLAGNSMNVHVVAAVLAYAMGSTIVASHDCDPLLVAVDSSGQPANTRFEKQSWHWRKRLYVFNLWGTCVILSLLSSERQLLLWCWVPKRGEVESDESADEGDSSLDAS